MDRLSALIEKTPIESNELRPYIGASSIGSPCARQIWYSYNLYESQPSPPRGQRNMEIGKRLEGMVLDWLERAGVEVIRPNEDNNFLSYVDSEHPYFRGHADALLPKLNAVVDIKIINSSSFKQFVTKGLKAWSEIYYAQLQSYMGMGNIPNAFLLALNKDSADLHDEHIKFNSAYYDYLKMRAELIHECTNAPAKISENPCWWLCKMCRFKSLCHDKIQKDTT